MNEMTAIVFMIPMGGFAMAPVVVGVVLWDDMLRTRLFAPVLRMLSESEYRWLGWLLPVSSGASAAIAVHSGGLNFFNGNGGASLFGGNSAIFTVGLLAGTYFTAVFSGWWLTLPDDPKERMRGWSALFLGTAFWFFEGLVFWLVGKSLRG